MKAGRLLYKYSSHFNDSEAILWHPSALLHSQLRSSISLLLASSTAQQPQRVPCCLPPACPYCGDLVAKHQQAGGKKGPMEAKLNQPAEEIILWPLQGW